MNPPAAAHCIEALTASKETDRQHSTDIPPLFKQHGALQVAGGRP
ncbi:MAG: hypothetical protein Q4F13_05215 [Pseudomonadota bacterium]|nr:hypothetical protein [Pseudomonadota bacterium]